MSPEEDRTRDAVDSEPKHYQLSYSGPLFLSELAKIVTPYLICLSRSQADRWSTTVDFTTSFLHSS